MKKILFFLFVIGLKQLGYSQPNLVTTATITATSTDASYPIANVKDGNASTRWQSSGHSTQYLYITLANSINCYATINLTNVVATDGFSVQFSTDNSTWTTVASNSGSSTSLIRSNLYLSNGTQFMPFKYIRIQLGANQGYASIAEAIINEGLINSFTGSGYPSSHPPFNAIDFNVSTYFENYGNSFFLTLQLSRSVGAISANINADVSNIKVSINGTGGTYDSYYFTQNPTEQFLIVNPGGIQTVTLSAGNAKVYDFTVEDIPMSNIPPLTYIYDNNGNMTSRTILLTMTKSANESAVDTIVPANPDKQDKPYTDEFAGKKIFVHPNPTTGLLTIDFKNLKEKDRVSVQLFSVTGQKIIEKDVTGLCTILELYDKKNGVYLLNIRVNSETHKWTIIKE